MKKRGLKILTLALLLSSCYNLQKPDVPVDLISEDKMVDVLIELTLVSSAKGINKRELENRGVVPDSFVYKKHKIDSLQFANSNNYYAYDIKSYIKIYDRVKDSLEILKTIYKKEDSIENVEKEKLKKSKSKKTKNSLQIDSTKIKKNLLRKMK